MAGRERKHDIIIIFIIYWYNYGVWYFCSKSNGNIDV